MIYYADIAFMNEITDYFQPLIVLISYGCGMSLEILASQCDESAKPSHMHKKIQQDSLAVHRRTRKGCAQKMQNPHLYLCKTQSDNLQEAWLLSSRQTLST